MTLIDAIRGPPSGRHLNAGSAALPLRSSSFTFAQCSGLYIGRLRTDRCDKPLSRSKFTIACA